MRLTFLVLVLFFLILGVFHEQWKREIIEERTGIKQACFWLIVSLLALIRLEVIYIYCAIEGYIPFVR